MDLNASMCIICEKNDDQPLFYGDFLKKSNTGAHYFCLLFSYNLPQRGKDNSGLLGFQINDIKKYVKSIRDNECVYCKNKSASVKCCDCQKEFHFICGFAKLCHFEFVGHFRSFCHLHVQIKHEYRHVDNESCGICLSAIGRYNPVLSISSKCCPREWFHRSCLMKYALSAGYYVKCIWCQNKEFRDEIRLNGIFVPDRDASWEMEPTAYLDLHRPKRRCNAEDCLCPKGKEYDQRNSRLWSLMLCCMCGAYPLHVGCYSSSSGVISNDFICNDCQLIRTSISLIVGNSHSNINNANGICDTNMAEEESSQLDKTLYLVKTLEQENFEMLHNNLINKHANKNLKRNNYQNGIFEIFQVLINSHTSSDQTTLKHYIGGFIQSNGLNAKVGNYHIEHALDLKEFCFEKGNIRGTILGTLISPKNIKFKFSLAEINPKIIELRMKSDSSSDSESDEDNEELFFAILEDELKKSGMPIENLRKKKPEKIIKAKKQSKTYFLESQQKLQAIVTASSLKNEKLGEKFEVDQIQIEKLIFFDNEVDSE